ncbi:hypothetical protein SAMN06295912_10193 [Sphingomonas laterariae]|uniref:Inner membrane protein n=1 Tax=Edaphosphingomonas laterariae TaxID=861865 RepID=A0A239BDH2_9SPHN|nr:YbaN family protein [Sphingomonas laterariae]SNS06055.1 hypothetical protein SAMN06295912_10193 [Sphingomonas laterariae]
MVRRKLYLVAGAAALATGTIGIFLPLLPTVPFYILAAFCFGRSNPAWEARLLNHPRFGVHIRAWRERGAISLRAKRLAVTMLLASAVVGLLTLTWPWSLLPATVALCTGTWIWTRPSGA